MKYKFKKHNWDKDIVIGVESDYKILNNFGSWNWTPEKVQEIIDGVVANKQLPAEQDPYVWGNEDVTIFANEIGVLLIDKMALRAQKDPATLELKYDVFNQFLQDFKKFVEENQ